MSSDPNYRDLEPPADKPRTEYQWPERRAELYDRIERVGSWRNLPQSLRDLGDQYDVSHSTIRKDIDRLLEWQKEHLGEDAIAELELLEGSIVEDYLDAARYYRKMASETDDPKERAKYLQKSAELKEKAFRTAEAKLRDLLQTGDIEPSADKLEIEGTLEHEGELGLTDEDREAALAAVRGIQEEQAANAGDDE